MKKTFRIFTSLLLSVFWLGMVYFSIISLYIFVFDVNIEPFVFDFIEFFKNYNVHLPFSLTVIINSVLTIRFNPSNVKNKASLVLCISLLIALITFYIIALKNQPYYNSYLGIIIIANSACLISIKHLEFMGYKGKHYQSQTNLNELV